MSDNFEKAADNVLSYYKYKRRSDSNEVRTMWTLDGRYAKGSEPFKPGSYSELISGLDFKDLDARAYTLYQKSKQTSEVSPKLKDVKNARLRLMFLSAVLQTLHRQYMGAQTNPGDRANMHRYERERKVIAFGMLKDMKERIKEEEE